jgi:hypothetical protein
MSLSLDNLDDMGFKELIKDAEARIPIYSPSWTNQNKSDPGVTLIELLAWLTEMQIYSLNRIGKQNYLKFLKLLGVARPKPSISAKADVFFNFRGEGTVTVDRGTLVAAVDLGTGKQICYQLEEKIIVKSGEEKKAPVVQGQLADQDDVSDGSAGFCIRLNERIAFRNESPMESMPLLAVKVGEKYWTFVEDLDSSKASDIHFSVDLDSGMVIFGDGKNGKIPPADDNIRVTYWTSVGAEGNLGKNLINRIIDQGLASKLTVTNKDPAFGGKDAESLDSAIERARKGLRSVTRAVTAADYERLALECDKLKIVRVKALARYHPVHDQPVPNVVSLVVVPESNVPCPVPDQNQMKIVYEYMSQCRMLGTELFVISPQYVEVCVEATVVRDMKFSAETVGKSVSEIVCKFLNPKSGGKNGSGWPFGGSVSVSQIYKVISDYGGVDYVKDVKIKKWDEGKWIDAVGGKLKIPAHALVYADQLNDCKIEVKEPGA